MREENTGLNTQGWLTNETQVLAEKRQRQEDTWEYKTKQEVTKNQNNDTLHYQLMCAEQFWTGAALYY